MNLLHLKNFPIYEQLQIEEALLRGDTRNFCIINEGSPPAIVMGISGKREELIDPKKHAQNPIPIIKRFSGGGTVVVDEETLFVSFVCERDLHDFPPYPEPIMRWTEGIYRKAFDLEDFHLRENDYVIGERKCGGNAQYLRKGRWLHHTTFLWNYNPELMDLLLHPKKAPKYRGERDHGAFLTCLSEHLLNREDCVAAIKMTLAEHFPLKELTLEEVRSHVETTHRQSTTLVSL